MSLPRVRWRRLRLYLVSIHTTIASRSSSRVSHLLVLRTFFCNREKKLSMAALSPAAPTRPMDPLMPLFVNNRNTFLDRFWLPRSACRIVPSGARSVIALLPAATTRDANVCESMEYPTILLPIAVFYRAEVQSSSTGLDSSDRRNTNWRL